MPLTECNLHDWYFEAGEECPVCYGYRLGKAREQERIATWIQLDMLLPEDLRNRIANLVRGGAHDDNQS